MFINVARLQLKAAHEEMVGGGWPPSINSIDTSLLHLVEVTFHLFSQFGYNDLASISITFSRLLGGFSKLTFLGIYMK